MSDLWIRADWPAPTGILAGTTTRLGGVSKGAFESLNLGAHVGDDRESVAENRRRFVAMCGLGAEPAWLRQVHGAAVARIGAADFDAGPPEADAAIGGESGDSCVVMTADCLPVLLCSRDGSEVAAVHGGWRGLARDVVAATVGSMSSEPRALMAWLGPAISQAAFEVGDEVRDAFVAVDAGAAACFAANDRGRWQADLYGIARRRLVAAGVADIYGGGRCTYGEPEIFFSHRRDGPCGRMASFVVRQC